MLEEELPYPYVHYPAAYGIFIGFSQGIYQIPVICDCARPAVMFAIAHRDWSQSFSATSDRAIASGKIFPKKISLESVGMGSDAIKYAPNLCHRCNLTVPHVNYCHPMYGGLFRQNFGWYIQQTALRLGVYRDHISDTCPDQIRHLSERIAKLSIEHNVVATDWGNLVDETSKSIRRDNSGVLDMSNLTSLQEAKMESARILGNRKKIIESDMSKITRKRDNIIENETRKEFGYRKIGDGWIGESILANIVKNIFPSRDILRNYRPEWLEGLELDVFVSDKNIGFEYQGQQHYRPMKHWGGEEAFKRGLERDERKRHICKALGVELIEISYRDPLTIDFVRACLPRSITDVS